MKVKGLPTKLEGLFDIPPQVIKIEAQFEEMPTTLLITLEGVENDKRAEILFKNVKGFRVLDEGDQLIFWENESRPEEWIWEIESGGWFDTERSTDGATMLGIISDQLKEFLVLGAAMCLNVICISDEQPIVTVVYQISR